MTAKILVPIDFSPVTESVVSWAASLARDRHASLILLHVQEPIADNLAGEMCYPMPLTENPGVRRPAGRYAKRSDDCLHAPATAGGVPRQSWLAEQEHVDLIVMGSHGRGWLGRLLMGSVAEQVMRLATCPVLVVKAFGNQPVESPSKPLARGILAESALVG